MANVSWPFPAQTVGLSRKIFI